MWVVRWELVWCERWPDIATNNSPHNQGTFSPYQTGPSLLPRTLLQVMEQINWMAGDWPDIMEGGKCLLPWDCRRPGESRAEIRTTPDYNAHILHNEVCLSRPGARTHYSRVIITIDHQSVPEWLADIMNTDQILPGNLGLGRTGVCLLLCSEIIVISTLIRPLHCKLQLVHLPSSGELCLHDPSQLHHHYKHGSVNRHNLSRRPVNWEPGGSIQSTTLVCNFRRGPLSAGPAIVGEEQLCPNV